MEIHIYYSFKRIKLYKNNKLGHNLCEDLSILTFLLKI